MEYLDTSSRAFRGRGCPRPEKWVGPVERSGGHRGDPRQCGLCAIVRKFSGCDAFTGMAGSPTGMIFHFEKAMGECGAASSFVSSIRGGTRASRIGSFTRVRGDDAGLARHTNVFVSIAMLALLACELMARHFSRRFEIA
jgi:hypothetical protein